MNREQELLTFLKEPVRLVPKNFSPEVPFHIRWIWKPFGGRGKGRWLVFRDFELTPHKPFSDVLVADLAGRGLLTPFCKENHRAFFLKELVPYTLYNEFSVIEKYKRA